MDLFVVDSWEDMEDAMTEGDLEVTEVIYKAVKRGVTRKFKKVTMFSVVLTDEPEYEYQWCIEKSEYRTALDNCLRIYTECEMYEKCAEIVKLTADL